MKLGKNKDCIRMSALTDYNGISNGGTSGKYSEPRIVKHWSRVHRDLKERSGTLPTSKSMPVTTPIKPISRSCRPLCYYVEGSSDTSSRVNFNVRDSGDGSKENFEKTLLDGTPRKDNSYYTRYNLPYFAVKDNQVHNDINEYSPRSRIRHNFLSSSAVGQCHSFNTSYESTDKNSANDASELANTIEEILMDERPISVGEVPLNKVVKPSKRKMSAKSKRRMHYYRRRQPAKIRRLERRTITKNPSLISDNLCVALVATLFCCLPLGIVALFYAWKVKRALSANKIDEARLYSLKGKKFANTGVMMGITCLALVVLVLIVKDNVPYSSLEYDYYLPDYVGLSRME